MRTGTAGLQLASPLSDLLPPSDFEIQDALALLDDADLARHELDLQARLFRRD